MTACLWDCETTLSMVECVELALHSLDRALSQLTLVLVSSGHHLKVLCVLARQDNSWPMVSFIPFHIPFHVP